METFEPAYREVLAYLFSQLPMYQRIGKAAYKASLENTIKLDEYFNRPHHQFRTIHVGGTNGKGSVCHILASVLEHAGYRTGLHTSPHLFDFRERVRINGRMMDEKEVIRFVSDHKSFFDTVKPSFFELSVFMAFDHFAGNGVDIAVIEVGLGGRLDSTNIITPDASVITNIGLDHTEFLGTTIEEIAVEKAGIIKPHVPVVIGENQYQIRTIFDRKARQQESALYFAQDLYIALDSRLGRNGKQTITIKENKDGREFTIATDLAGSYQRKNVVTCLAVIDILRQNGLIIHDGALSKGLATVGKTTGFTGRWQVCGHHPLTICDTAHNYEGILEVVRQIGQTPHQTLHMIIGFVVEKDLTRIMKILPADAVYYFTRPGVPRGLDSKVLSDIAGEYGLSGESFNKVADAYDQARENAAPGDLIFASGSIFLVADFLQAVKY